MFHGWNVVHMVLSENSINDSISEHWVRHRVRDILVIIPLTSPTSIEKVYRSQSGNLPRSYLRTPSGMGGSISAP